MDVHAVLGAHPVFPVLGQPQPVSTDQVEPGAAAIFGADLEARGVDQAVQRILRAGHDHAGRRDALDALAVAVDQMDARQVEGLQVGIVEAGPLAELTVPGLQVPRGRRIMDDRVDAGADLLHLLVIGVLERSQHALARPLLLGQRQDALADSA